MDWEVTHFLKLWFWFGGLGISPLRHDEHDGMRQLAHGSSLKAPAHPPWFRRDRRVVVVYSLLGDRSRWFLHVGQDGHVGRVGQWFLADMDPCRLAVSVALGIVSPNAFLATEVGSCFALWSYCVNGWPHVAGWGRQGGASSGVVRAHREARSWIRACCLNE